jgi:hypothetical protein
MRPFRRETLLQSISKEEARLARLEATEAAAGHRLSTLQAELAALGCEPQIRVRPQIVVEYEVPRTSAQKVAISVALS